MGASEMLRSQLLLLLRLGADPNTIVTVSPLDVGAFGAVADEDCALLLLEYGYNIHVIEERRGKKFRATLMCSTLKCRVSQLGVIVSNIHPEI